MLEALKILFLFQKPTWDDYKEPYIFFGIVAWIEVIALIIGFITI